MQLKVLKTFRMQWGLRPHCGEYFSEIMYLGFSHLRFNCANILLHALFFHFKPSVNGFWNFPNLIYIFFPSHLRVYNTKNYKNKCKTYKSQLPVSIEDKENPGQFKVEERNVRLFHDDTFQSFYRRLGKLFSRKKTWSLQSNLYYFLSLLGASDWLLRIM